MFSGKNILLGVTGGIAAYKAAALASALKKLGANVEVILTKNAGEFITPLTFETLTGNAVITDTFSHPDRYDVAHVSLAKKTDVCIIAPATANVIGKMANGIADDMLTTTYLALKCPVFVAPAMNTAMYEHAAVRENIAKIQARGCQIIEPGEGLLACGDVGAGRMAEPEEIISFIQKTLAPAQDYAGLHVLVTAGPTQEPIDPVRYITNRSSGKMGYALAEEAMRRGTDVLLITGPVSLTPPIGVEVENIVETRELYDVAVRRFPSCDVAIMAGAPADYRPETVAEQKIKKTANSDTVTLKLIENADIAATLGHMKREDQVLVVYAAETENLLNHARAKLIKKNADLAVANDVTEPGAGFDSDTNKVSIVTVDETVSLPMMTKAEVACAILNRVEKLLKH